MRPRLAVIYLLLVLLPLGLLYLLGQKLAEAEQSRVQASLDRLKEQRLVDLHGTIKRLVADVENELLRATDFIPAAAPVQVELQQQARIIQPTYDTPQLRSLVRSNRFVRQFFAISADNQFLHPPTSAPTQTAQEKRFYERTLSVWESGQRFYEPMNDAWAAGPVHGWHTWFWGEGVNLLFWRRTAASQTLGAEVDVAAFQAELIARLPANTDWATDDRGDAETARIRLIDASGKTLYEWGAYEPATQEPSRASIPVAEPFAMWSLQYFSDLANAGVGTLPFDRAASLLALGTLLILLALYFYKENTRELRTASQRVTFVNQVSHELKTPLTNIRMYADLLEEQIPEEDKQPRNYIKVITDESRRLTRLIANVLTFAQSQRQDLRLHKTSARPDDILHSILEHFRPALEARGFKIELDLNAAADADLDADLLEQILGNLVGNVEKYAPEGKYLALRSRQDGGILEITVGDHGPGIPPDQRETIFQPFHRVSNQLSDGVSGTGIGLSIARELARLHGGDLTLLPADKGATFHLTLRT